MGGVTCAVLALIVVFLYKYVASAIVPDIYNSTSDNVFLLMFFLTPIVLWGKPFAFMYILGPIVWFIPGSIIGWLYGKIRNRKSSS